ncbi:hypothetical protein R1sor_008759 [Riccia sorocarpa]|uniref:Uncharacterized protein n=1 Tax=Riccia sorocarpa TaxID=122646 RepID=A0ABD3HUP5_9MARC
MRGGGSRWVRPEVFPTVAVVVAAIGMNIFCLARNALGNPDVRFSKEERASGYLENYKEGKKYKYHALREYVSKQEPGRVMPRIDAALDGLRKYGLTMVPDLVHLKEFLLRLARMIQFNLLTPIL